MKCWERMEDQVRKDMHKIRSPTLGDEDIGYLKTGDLKE
jgi:hypothetical protein